MRLERVRQIVRPCVRPLAVVAALAFIAAVPAASAQQKANAPAQALTSRSFALVADSIAVGGDSLRAIALLDSALHRTPRDAEMWHRYGLILWSMTRSKRNETVIKDRTVVQRLSAADSALRLAVQFAPDSAQYWMDLVRFNQGSRYGMVRNAASGELGHALDAAEKSHDSLRIAQAVDEQGMFAWRRYEVFANRALTTDQQAIQLSAFNNWNRAHARDYVESFVHKIEPPTGETDFNLAQRAFLRATRADPTSLRANRHVLMTLAERKLWPDMAEEAQRRLTASPWDYQAWLAMGLAKHRMNRDAEASAAFDSAFVLLDEATQARYNRLSRILRPKWTDKKKNGVGDSSAFAQLTPDSRRGVESMYWLLADPLTLTAENEFRLEFLARVTHAEMRWTDETANVMGADTERGDIFVRYGPPDLEITVAGGSSDISGSATLVWMYKQSGLVFFFDLSAAIYGTAHLAFFDRDNVDQIKSATPVRWDNVPASRLIDTIPVRIARFRVGPDSLDAVVTAGIPLDSLVHGLGVAGRVPVDIDIRVYDEHAMVRGVESSQASVQVDSAPSLSRRQWTRRVGPGLNLLRIEALQPDGKRAARSITQINPEHGVGFGMSDLLLGNKPSPRSGATDIKRWSDVDIEPGLGTYRRGSPIGLVWENYELTDKGGSSNYHVQIQVERVTKAGAGGIVARIVDGVGRTMGKEAKGASKLSIGFDRKVAARPTVVEYFSVDLSQSPEGDYRVTIEITDLASLKKTSRSSTFTMRNEGN